MRLRERDKREVMVFPSLGLDEDVCTWGEGVMLRAAVYPAGMHLASDLCGEQVQEERLMLYDGELPLQVGMGVSLDGGAPAYRITALELWSHARAKLTRIPQGRRVDVV